MAKLLQTGFWILFIAFLAVFLTRNIFDYREKIGFYDQIMGEKQKEVEKNKNLTGRITHSQDLTTIEQDIRKKLNLLKPNEIAIIIPKVSISPTPTIQKPVSIPFLWFELLLQK